MMSAAEIQTFGAIWGLFAFLVFVAIGVDLVSGWRKATIRHEAHTSYALSRTITKILMYQGTMIVTGCIDIVLTVCKIAELVHLSILQSLPLFSGLMCILLCLVELKSIYEKAEDKSRKRIKETAEMINYILHRGGNVDELKKALGKYIRDEKTVTED